MSDWQPIETAPTDGMAFMSYWRNVPVLVAWIEREPSVHVEDLGWFRKRKTERVERGWRVLSLGREGMFGIHGNYAPFEPTHWMPIPQPPYTNTGAK